MIGFRDVLIDVLLLATVSALGCHHHATAAIDASSLAVGEQMVVSDSGGEFIVEFAGDDNVIFYGSSGVVTCGLSPEILGAWGTVKAAAEGGETRVGSQVTIDPNLYWHAVTIVQVLPTSGGEFVMRYVEDEENTLRASLAIDRILEVCGIPRRVKLRVVVRKGP